MTKVFGYDTIHEIDDGTLSPFVAAYAAISLRDIERRIDDLTRKVNARAMRPTVSGGPPPQPPIVRLGGEVEEGYYEEVDSHGSE